MGRNREFEGLRGRRPWSEEQAREVLDAWRASGESVPVFAARAGLGAQRIYWWRERLGEATAAISPPTQLVPVAVRLPVDEPLRAAAAIEVLDQHLRIEVGSLDGTSSRWIVDLVRSLRAPA